MIYLSLNYPYLSIDGVNFAEALLLAYTSQTFAKTTPEVSFSFTNVKNWASAAEYAAINKIFRLVRM